MSEWGIDLKSGHLYVHYLDAKIKQLNIIWPSLVSDQKFSTCLLFRRAILYDVMSQSELTTLQMQYLNNGLLSIIQAKTCCIVDSLKNGWDLNWSTFQIHSYKNAHLLQYKSKEMVHSTDVSTHHVCCYFCLCKHFRLKYQNLKNWNCLIFAKNTDKQFRIDKIWKKQQKKGPQGPKRTNSCRDTLPLRTTHR